MIASNDQSKILNSKNKKIYLIDGTAYVYRAYYAMNLTTAAGKPTGAIYTMVNMLNGIIRDHAPDYMVTVFDAKGKTFRDDIFPEYKANRKPMPDDLRPQYEIIQKLVPAMGIPVLCIPKVEADDVIGTLAVQAEKQNLFTVIASNDKDLAQLVTDQIVLLDEKRSIEIGSDGVQEKFGVPPNRIADYLALVGDNSDNIPGVPGVGAKTASKWLHIHGSLDEIVANADQIGGKVGENLRNGLEQLKLSRELVELKLDVDVEFNLTSFQLVAPDTDVLREIYSQHEFRTFLAELNGDSDHEHKDEINYTAILDEDSLDQLITQLQASDVFGLDTETTGINARQDSLVGISVSVQENEAFYIPVAHNYLNAPEQLNRDLVLEKLAPVLQSESIAKVIQNAKFDKAVFAKYGVEVKGCIYDTMLESYVLNSTGGFPHSLDKLSEKYLGHITTKYEDVAGRGKKQITFDQVEVEQATTYAAEDADIALRLHKTLWPKLKDNKALLNVYESIEMPLTAVLSRMENNGVLLDRDELSRQSAELQTGLERVQREIFELSGTEFNLSSPMQIREVLYEKLGLHPTNKKTSKGALSTSEQALRELALFHDVPKLILEYRGLFKLKSTYTDTLPALIDPDSGRVHTSYQQAVATTGRLSSTDPNLQNIPIRTPEGKRVREAFIAEPGHVLLSIDYSQIELRLMAHLSSDEGLLEAFNRGGDVHRSTAAEVFGVDEESVTADQRRNAKGINFGLIYGMSAFGLGQQLQIEQSLARDYIDQYFQKYPKVKEYMDTTRKKAAKDQFVETIFSRRFHVQGINDKNFPRRQHAERTAINAPLQGSAADIIKLAMIEVDQWIMESSRPVRMIMQVHDELVFEVSESEVEPVRLKISEIMEKIATLSVPLIVDSGVGTNWATAHD